MHKKREIDEQGPVATLLGFFDAMQRWEVESRTIFREIEAGRLDPDAGVKHVRSALQTVFVAFCAGELPLERFAAGRVCFGADTPIYGRAMEHIVNAEVNEASATIQTKNMGPPVMTLIYTLANTSDGWRIRDNRRRVRGDGSTTPWDL